MQAGRIFICLLFILTAINVKGGALTDSLKKSKKFSYDSNYVKQYPHRLVITYFQSYRRYEITFSEKVRTDTLSLSKSLYKASSQNTVGLSLDYDKLSFSVGRAQNISSDVTGEKGNTISNVLGFSVTSGKLRFENTYRNYFGFYDENSLHYNKYFGADTSRYYIKPSMQVHSIKTKIFYFINRKHRFSFMSAYGNTQRQIKRAGSFFWVANAEYYNIYSKTPFISPLTRNYYGLWKNLNNINTVSLSVIPGYSFNLVLFKALFLNVTLAYGLASQYRSYSSSDNMYYVSQFKTSMVGDYRVALGINNRNFFMTFTTSVDYYSIDTKSFKVESKYIWGAFNIGYRFKLKERNWIKRIKEHELYKKV